MCAATLCEDQCVDTTRSPSHCGECGRSCGEGQFCEAGSCTARCNDELVSCGGACVDARTDRENCGECDSLCPDGGSCIEGNCACGGGNIACGDRCVDPTSDPDHCGACDRACGDGETCRAETCALACGAGPCAPGELVFTRALPAQSAPVVVGDVAILENGESVVAGTFRGELNLGSSSATALGTDVFVARFDRRGHLRWLRRYGAEGADMTVGDLLTTDERIVVVGSLDGTVTFEATELTTQGVDALVLELTHDGLVEATEVFGGPGRQRLTAVASFDGGLALGGEFAPSLERNGTALGTSDGSDDLDAFVLLRDATGATAWSALANDPGQMAPQTVAGLGLLNGLLGATLTSEGPATVGAESIGAPSPSGALITWDRAGALQWTLVATSDDEVTAPRIPMTGALMAVTHRGSLALTSPCGTLDLAVADGEDAVLFELDGTGCPETTTRFGGAGDQHVSSLALDGAAVVAGRFDQTLTVDGTEVASGDAAEMFVTRLGPSSFTTTGARPACGPDRCGLAVAGPRAYVATTFTGLARRYPSPLAATGDEGDGLLGLLSLDDLAD